MARKKSTTATFEKYGLTFTGMNEVQAEMHMIRNGGQWTQDGIQYGNGLFYHYKALQTLLWPEDDHHRWSDLILKSILEERITIVLGPKDSSKTRTLAKFGLVDYLCFPQITLTLVSSTDLRGLELRVWGDIKELFNRARDVEPSLPGNIVDSKHGIFTDDIKDETKARTLKRGLLCIPCVGSQGEWQGGLEKFAGIKQKRRRVIGDETGFMEASYLSAIEHLDKGDFIGAFAANPIGQNDPADKIAEPIGGWGTEPDTEKTECWRNKWGGVTINLDGRDTPNNDEPTNRFPYLIKQEDIDRTAGRCGKDSMEYWVQVVGKRKPGLFAHRVLTVQMCEKFGAFQSNTWRGSATTKIYAIDASYGGDRCVGGSAEFGKDINDQLVLHFGEQVVIPINVNSPDIPEDQIAMFVKRECDQLNIPPENVFFDSTGRGSLGTSFARIWNARVNPVEFGGAATDRPVSSDIFVTDQSTGQRRLKRCNEHYSKRVTEFWFSVRYVVESKQARNFPRESADEFAMREWYIVSNNRYELETKEDTKARMGRSPDKADQTAIIVEGARRLGFKISKIERSGNAMRPDTLWKSNLRNQAEDLKKSYTLSHAA